MSDLRATYDAEIVELRAETRIPLICHSYAPRGLSCSARYGLCNRRNKCNSRGECAEKEFRLESIVPGVGVSGSNAFNRFERMWEKELGKPEETGWKFLDNRARLRYSGDKPVSLCIFW